jgi:hypothetical protein
MTVTREMGAKYRRCLSSFLLMLGLLGFLAACDSDPDNQNWVRIGETKKDDVIARYGNPDVLVPAPGGETAIYLPTDSEVPQLEIPITHAGPSGTQTTRMQSIEPDLGATETGKEGKVVLRKELRIRYDDQGVVQALSSP